MSLKPAPTWLSYLALIAASVCWGVGFPLAKVTFAELGPAHMILLRYAIASLLSLPLILRNRASRRALSDPSVIIAGTFYGPTYLIQFEGVARATVSLSALLIGAIPALIAVAARIVFREQVRPLGWLGIAVAAIGAGLLAGQPGESSGLGMALIAVSIVLSLGWILTLRKAASDIDPVAASCCVVLVGTIVDLPIILLMHGPPPVQLSAGVWAALLGQSVLSTVLALVFWQLGARAVPAAISGVFLNVEPLVGAIAGIIWFGDAITPLLVLGGIAILIGSTVVTRANSQPAASHI